MIIVYFIGLPALLNENLCPGGRKNLPQQPKLCHNWGRIWAAPDTSSRSLPQSAYRGQHWLTAVDTEALKWERNKRKEAVIFVFSGFHPALNANLCPVGKKSLPQQSNLCPNWGKIWVTLHTSLGSPPLFTDWHVIGISGWDAINYVRTA